VFHSAAARYVGPERAREIVAALPPFVTPVGLFVDATPESVRELAGSLGLRHVQLHGHEDANCVRELKDFVVIKAVRVDRQTFVSEMNGWREEIRRGDLTNLRAFVLETAAAAPGGTGIVNDWEYVQQCQARGVFDDLPPIIAAGGVTPDNVADVVRTLKPWAVDVSSGVEASKGIKSVEKMVEFARAVRAVER